MDEQHTLTLRPLRDRIRAVCVHDQAQWDATWKEVLRDASNRRGLIPPSVFFEVLEANSILLGRSEARLLIWQFQEPNGAVAASKFLRWIALSAPADHMNPDLVFAQLPQPYRRIQKVLDHDIFDAAWEIITTESARFKAESFTGEGAMGSSRSNRDTHRAGNSQNHLHEQRNDYDAAKRRSCEPTWQIPLDHNSQRVIGLASHCLLPIVVAAINNEPLNDSATNATPLLRAVSTVDKEVKALGDFPIAFPLDAPGPTDVVTRTHVSIKKVSGLQLAFNASCCLAVHLVETTRIESTGLNLNLDVMPPAPTTRECVSVYSITTQAPVDGDRAFSCQLIAVISPTQVSTDPSVLSIVLSPDSAFVAVTFVGSRIIALYSLHRERDIQEAEVELQPLILSSPQFQVDLEVAHSPFMEDESAPTLNFLVAPAGSRAQYRSSTPAAPRAHALAVCYGLKVLKYMIPSTSTSPPSPVVLIPAKSWDHLTEITALALDLTTQYVIVGCQDGTIVMWDVLQDIDYAFLSPSAADGNTERSQSTSTTEEKGASVDISSVIFCQAGYIVALSQSQQRLYFFDVRSRGRPELMRVVSPPVVPSSTSTHHTSSHSAVSMISIAESTATADTPVALVEYSNKLVVLYDVRVAEAIGSFRTTLSVAVSPTAHPATSPSAQKANIVGNQDTLAVVATSETCVNLYSWRDILLACFPSFSATLEQRQKELTCSNVKQLFLSSDDADAPAAAPPSTITAPSASIDLLETMFLRMAGELPQSPQRTKKLIAGASSPLQFPVSRSSVFHVDSLTYPSQLSQRQSLDAPVSRLGITLQPIVPDKTAFFEQYCLECLDPLVIADKEARLHRKRRELLKVMSAGGSW